MGEADRPGEKPQKPSRAKPKRRFNDNQRWAMARLAENGTLTPRDVEQEFDISDRTVKRVLGTMSDAGPIKFDRTTYPGFYRMK